MSEEIKHATMEAERNHAEDEYFKARPQSDFPHKRHLFCAGFDRGYKAREQALEAEVERLKALLKSAACPNKCVSGMYQIYTGAHRSCQFCPDRQEALAND